MPKATSIYTVRTGKEPEWFTVSKMSQDYEPQAIYNIQEVKGGGMHCDCPAHKPWCRHMDVLRKFQAEERVNSGWFFNHDLNKWIEPIPTEEA
jgi:hypothetical protein